MTTPPKPDNEILFTEFEEQPPAESVCALFYGRAKSGKTEAAGSAGDRTCYIDVGKSSETFHSIGFKTRKGPFKGIYVAISEDEAEKYSIIPDKATGFDRLTDAVDTAFSKHMDRFDTLVVDEATAMRRYSMYKSLEIGQKIGGSKSLTNAQKLGVAIPEIGDYHKEMSMTEQFIAGTIDRCKTYGKHFILIAHERHTFRKPEKPGGEDTLIKIAPGFTGKTFPDALANMFDMVLYFEVFNGDTFRVRMVGNDALMAGHRYSGIFKEYEQNLNWQDVIRRIREQIPLPPKKK